MKSYQKEYLNRLGPRVEALQLISDNFNVETEDAAASARRIAHTLRGSGGTYGFPEISRLAQAVEEAGPKELKNQLDELIQYLRQISQTDFSDKDSVLIIDDSEEMLILLSMILDKQGYRTIKAGTGGEARTLLKENPVSLILLDLILPDTDGRNFLIELKENLSTSSTPVIVLSAKNSPQIKAECYALGAEDYFEKPIDPGLLITKVAASIQAAKEANRDSREDNLTGLMNRAAFREYYEQASGDAGSQKTPLCLAVVDLDHFKAVNDQYGHLTGDAVLRYVTQTMTKHLGKHDIFGRWGGEEFTILFPKIDCAAAKHILDSILEYLSSHPFLLGSDHETLSISFSAGLIDVNVNAPFDEVFAAADKLLYSAKEAGRNRVVTSRQKIETSQKSILLAEDDSLTAEFIMYRLGRSDFKITHYLEGDKAFDAASRETFDLVITDVKMPGMDGFELVQRIRHKSLNQKTPLIMLTSMGRESDISRGLKLGADDYILKPFSPTELLARVRRLLK